MKRLNRKGFTLVELLAVIIILAIVVGITIPAILTTTSKARDKAFQTSVDSFANWLDRQHEAYNLGNELIMQVDQAFTDYCTENGVIKTTCDINADLLEAGGLKPNNYDLDNLVKDYNLIKLIDGKYIVRLHGSKDGDYATTEAKSNDPEYNSVPSLSGMSRIGEISKMSISELPSRKEMTKQARKKL